jgi:hypothetical protein
VSDCDLSVRSLRRDAKECRQRDVPQQDIDLHFVSPICGFEVVKNVNGPS